jgi:hypothetical protein
VVHELPEGGLPLLEFMELDEKAWPFLGCSSQNCSFLCFISLFSVVVIKYLNLGTLQRKEMYLSHTFGGSSPTGLASSKGLLATLQYGGRDHMAEAFRTNFVLL